MKPLASKVNNKQNAFRRLAKQMGAGKVICARKNNRFETINEKYEVLIVQGQQYRFYYLVETGTHNPVGEALKVPQEWADEHETHTLATLDNIAKKLN